MSMRYLIVLRSNPEAVPIYAFMSVSPTLMKRYQLCARLLSLEALQRDDGISRDIVVFNMRLKRQSSENMSNSHVSS